MTLRKIITLVLFTVALPSQTFARESNENLKTLRTKLCRAWSAVFGSDRDCGPKNPPQLIPPGSSSDDDRDPRGGVPIVPELDDAADVLKRVTWWFNVHDSWQSLSPDQRQTIYHSTRLAADALPFVTSVVFTETATADETLEYQLQYSSVEKFLTDFTTANAVMTMNPNRVRLFAFYSELMDRMN